MIALAVIIKRLFTPNKVAGCALEIKQACLTKYSHLLLLFAYRLSNLNVFADEDATFATFMAKGFFCVRREMEIDLVRWMNELTHKYLELVRSSYCYCLDLPTKPLLDAQYRHIFNNDLSEKTVEAFSVTLHKSQDELEHAQMENGQ